MVPNYISSTLLLTSIVALIYPLLYPSNVTVFPSVFKSEYYFY